MSDTPGYQTFAAAVQALPSDTAVYFRHFDAPFTCMAPMDVLNEPLFAQYTGIRHAFRADLPHPESPMAHALDALDIDQPIVWHITRGEPVATVVWGQT